MPKIENKTSIAILMATYNGEKYLREQIDSILCQTNRDWTLYIQDDGSKDATLEIIKSYNDERIVLVDVGLTRQGACMNFMSLLNMVESEYYMFCDQDDVWFENKVELSYECMKEEELRYGMDKPVLVFSDASRINANGEVILEQEFNRKNWTKEQQLKIIEERSNINMLRLLTICAGCKMFFNHKVKEVALPYCNLRYQDSVIAMAVAEAGGVFSCILEPLMYYRLHATNTCGVHETLMFNKLKNIIETIKGQWRFYYLWKIYGGGNFIKFLYYRYRLFVTRF